MRAESSLSQAVPFLLLLLLTACSSGVGTFRLEGKFNNMNQAEFYIFDYERGFKDTIIVQRGHFAYETAIKDTTTLWLMFPNYSTIPIIAHTDAKLEIEGDASNLKQTKVTGSEENDELSAFRLRTNQMTPPEERAEAKQFILEHPASYISYYLLQTYFVRTIDPDYQEAYRLSKLMLEATPSNLQVMLLNTQLYEIHRGLPGSRLPNFLVLDTKGKVRSNKDLSKKLNVVCLYSSWNYDSQRILQQAQQLQRQHPKDIALMAICIDATINESRTFVKNDTITAPIVCDGKLWQTPLARKMGLTSMPANLIADRNGKILKCDFTEAKAMKEEIEKMLESK